MFDVDARVEHQALPPAVGGDEADAAPRRRGRRRAAAPAPSAIARPSPARRPSRAEQHPEQRRHARSLETGEADDLARARLEVDVLQLAAERQAADGQAGRPARRDASGRGAREQLGRRRRRPSPRRPRASWSRRGRTVETIAPLRITVMRSAIVEDLLEPVRDVEHRDPVAPTARAGSRTAARLALVERRVRLVEDEHAAAARGARG